MKDLIKALDNLSWVVKLILCIPVLDIVWTVYRLLRSIKAKNTLAIVLSIVLFLCAPFIWIFDLICIILNNKVWWFC